MKLNEVELIFRAADEVVKVHFAQVDRDIRGLCKCLSITTKESNRAAHALSLSQQSLSKFLPHGRDDRRDSATTTISAITNDDDYAGEDDGDDLAAGI